VGAERRLAALSLDDAEGKTAGMCGLFAARNCAARRLGWRDFYSLSLALGDLEDVDPKAVMGAAERATRDEWEDSRRRREGAGLVASGGRVSEPDAGRIRPLVARTEVGLGEVRIDMAKVGTRLVSRTYCIDAPRDVRVVVTPVQSMASRRAFWHEMGHAAYAAHLDPQLPWGLAAPPARCFDEGVAELLADLAESHDFVVEDLAISHEEAAALCRERRAARLAWRRWQLARASFERHAYLAPDADLTHRWRALVREYVGAVDAPSWTSLGHLRTDPGCQLEYLVADRICQSLGKWLARCHQPRMPREAVAALKSRVFRLGAILGWRDLVGSHGHSVGV
jgi:hypothetical protein